MTLITFVLAMLAGSPDCIPASEETLILFHLDRPVCVEPYQGQKPEYTKEVDHGRNF